MFKTFKNFLLRRKSLDIPKVDKTDINNWKTCFKCGGMLNCDSKMFKKCKCKKPLLLECFKCGGMIRDSKMFKKCECEKPLL